MTVQNLIGNQPNQIPRNSDLGGLSTQSASRVYIKDGVISNVGINSSVFGTINKDDNYPTQQPSMKFDFAKSKVVDPRLQSHRNTIATYTDSRGYIKTAHPFNARINHKDSVCEGLLLEPASANSQTYSQNFEVWSNTGITVDTLSTISPDGTLNAQKFIADSGTGAHRASSPSLITITDGEAITVSVYVKYIDRKYIRLGLWDSSSSTCAFFAIFDILNGNVNSTGITGDGVVLSNTITSDSNGWYRLTVTGTIPGFTESRVFINMYNDSLSRTWTADNTSVYIWGAQVERAAAKVSSYIPNVITNGGYNIVNRRSDMTTGGSTAFYASDISSSLDILQLQLYPGEIPFTFIQDTSSGTHKVEFWNYTPYPDKEWYVSIYVAAVGTTKFKIAVQGVADEYGQITATYDTETISVTDTTGTIVGIPTATIERVNTTNWYKLTIRGFAQDATTYQNVIYPNSNNGDRAVRAILYALDSSGNSTFTGDGTTKFIYSKCYFLDWKDGNSVDASDQIGDTNYFTTASNATCFTNNIYAPDGTETASYLYVASGQAVSIANVSAKYLNFVNNFTHGTYVVKSFYAKYGGVQYAFSNSVWFDLQNGTLTNTSNALNQIRATMTSVGSGWYKCEIFAKLFDPQTNGFGIGMSTTNGSISFTGNGGGIYIWGMRSYLTDFYPNGSVGTNSVETYYPTTASTYNPPKSETTRRAADLLWMTTSSSWYNSAEGTIVADIGTGSTGFAVSLQDTTTATPSYTDSLSVGVFDGYPTLLQNNYLGTEYTNQYGLKEIYADNESRLAFGYKGSDCAINANNGETLNILDVTSIPSSLNLLTISSQFIPFNGTIKRITYYPFRVTDTELQELSKK